MIYCGPFVPTAATGKQLAYSMSIGEYHASVLQELQTQPARVSLQDPQIQPARVSLQDPQIQPARAVDRLLGDRRICRHHKAGYCGYGPSCGFEHPNRLQPTRSSDNRDPMRGIRDFPVIYAKANPWNNATLGAPLTVSRPITRQIVPDGAPHLENLFAVDYDWGPYPFPFQVCNQCELRNRSGGIKLGGVNGTLPPVVIAHLFSFLTGARVSAIDQFSPHRGLCLVWIESTGDVKEQSSLEERCIETFRNQMVWMGPIAGLGGIIVAKDAPSKEFLLSYLATIGSRNYFPTHPVTAQEWRPNGQQGH